MPLVNGEGQEQPPKGRRPDPFTKTRAGELIEFSSTPPRIVVTHPVYRRDAKAMRTLSIDEGRLNDVTTIESTSGHPQKLGLSLHLQGKVRLPDTFIDDPDFAKGRPKSFTYWSNVRGASFDDEVSFDVEYDGVTLHVTFAVPGKFQIWHASTPDPPPNRREGFYLETFGESATFATTFEPLSQQMELK